jgi:hypothetical protein
MAARNNPGERSGPELIWLSEPGIGILACRFFIVSISTLKTELH